MASKKDLIEAQSFSRRRLLTAFTSGAVGTAELEPAKPLRAVVAGLAITALVVVGGLFYSLLSPGLPSGWENNHLIITKDTGARYVSSEGVLYPVLNAASARLVVPAENQDKKFIITTTSKRIADIPVGQPIGILGAPDQLPLADRLVPTGWSACITEDRTVQVSISSSSASEVSKRAALVTSDREDEYVIFGQYRYLVNKENRDAVLRAVGLSGLDAQRVDDRWLNLFLKGDELKPLIIRDSGDQISGSDLQIGQILHITGDPDDVLWVIMSDGTVSSLSPLAYQLLILRVGQNSEVTEVKPTDISSLGNATEPAGGDHWPQSRMDPLTGASLCAVSGVEGVVPTTELAEISAEDLKAQGTASVTVDAGRGAVVRAGGHGPQNSAVYYIIDATGTAFPISSAEAVQRLGYVDENVSQIHAGWIALLPVGPPLSIEEAGQALQVLPETEEP